MKNLQEQISRIQEMMGVINESHSGCGIIYEPELKKDLESTNIFDMVVNYRDELIDTLKPKKQRLSPTKKVYSVQKDINMDYVNDMSDETYDKKDTRVALNFTDIDYAYDENNIYITPFSFTKPI